jgi:hypothetical protein
MLSEALHLSPPERTELEAAARKPIAPPGQTAGEGLLSPQRSLSTLPFVGRAHELALLEQVLAD